MPARAPTLAPGAPAWDYEVLAPASLDLEIRATLQGPFAGALHVDDEAMPFVEALERETDGRWTTTGLDAGCMSVCRFRYRFRLRAAAERVRSADVAITGGGAVVAPPSAWLLRPAHADRDDARYRFRVTIPVPPGGAFVTGVRPSRDRANSYEAPASTLEGDASYAAFGALRTTQVAEPRVMLTLAGGLPRSDADCVAWARRATGAIAGYVGRAPDDRVTILALPNREGHTTHGKTFGDGGASVLIRLGDDPAEPPLEDDWVLAHELVHVSMPGLPREQMWFEEGMATYVEPIARARAGLIPEERVWVELAEGLARGAAATDAGTPSGLDGTRDIDRVYWGGALYFFVADLRVREATNGERGLEHGMRAVGANVETHWSIREMLDALDRGTATKIFSELYEELGVRPGRVDVTALMRRIGVQIRDNHAVFDDSAPLATARKALMTRR